MLLIKSDAKPVHLSPNNCTGKRVAIPSQLKFLWDTYGMLHFERGTSSRNIAHGAVDDRAASAKDNFSGF
jgi:hypothetical protein